MGDGMTHIANGTYLPSRQPTEEDFEPIEFAKALVGDEVRGAPPAAIALARAHIETVAALRELVDALGEFVGNANKPAAMRESIGERAANAVAAARKVLG